MNPPSPSADHRCRTCSAPLNSQRASEVCPSCALEHALQPAPSSDTVPIFSPTDDGSPTPAHQPPCGRFGDYDLIEEIARGGMGVVFKARQASMDRVVALKMLLFGPLASPESVQRFRTEATAAGSLQHPHIVGIHEVGIHQGQHYLVMDYVAGRSLAEIVRDGPLPPARAAGYVKTIAEAVHYAHERGVLHRDLKPSNVLLDENDQPKVTDFGLAKRLEKDTELTLSGQVLGSPGYMAPEQAAAHRGLVGKRSDVFSLGAVLFHLVTGRPPFVAATVAETLQQVQNADPVSPTVLNPHVPRDLKTICLKCLEKEPARRYQTARELTEDLGRWLAKEPILARPMGPAGRAWRWCRRKPVIATLSVMTMLLVLAVAIGSPIALFHINKHRRDAEQKARDLRLSLYAADVNLAKEAVRLHNLGRASELLDRHRPVPGQPDLRGWEWRYLWGQCQGQSSFRLCHLPGPDSVGSVAIRPGANWVALGGYMLSGVEVWDLATRRRLAQLAPGESYAYLAFSPDGSRLAFSTWSQGRKIGWLRVWDCRKREAIAEKPLDREIVALAFSGDSQRIATFQPSRSVTCWRASNLETNLSVPAPGGAGFASLGTRLAVTPDFKTAVVVNGRAGLVVLNLERGEERWKTNADLGDSPAVAISPDGTRLATASVSPHASIQLWELATGARLARLERHGAWICALRFSPDGETLMSASADRTIRLWDLGCGEATRTLQGHQHEIWSLDMSPDAATLVSGGKDGEVLVWDLRREAESRSPWTLPGRHWAWHFSTDGRAIHAIERPPDAPSRNWRWPNQGRALGGSLLEHAPGRVVRYSGPTFEQGEVFGEVTLAGDFVFSASGRLLANATTNGVLRVWDLDQRTLAHEVPVPTTDFRPVVFSSDEGRVWLLHAEGQERVRSVLTEWDLQTKQPLRRLPGVRDSTLALAPGDWVSWMSDDGVRMFHDFKTGRTSAPAIAKGRLAMLFHAAASANGNFLSLCHELGIVTVWQTAALRGGGNPTRLRTLRGLGAGIGVCAFLSDDQRLLGGGHGTEAVMVWETQAFHELLTLPAEGGWFNELQFSPDGRFLGAQNASGQVYLWQAPACEEIAARENAARAASRE